VTAVAAVAAAGRIMPALAVAVTAMLALAVAVIAPDAEPAIKVEPSVPRTTPPIGAVT